MNTEPFGPVEIFDQETWLDLNDAEDNASELLEDYEDRMRQEGWG